MKYAIGAVMVSATMMLGACALEVNFKSTTPSKPVEFTGIAAIQIPESYTECQGQLLLVRQFSYSLDAKADEWHAHKDGALHRKLGGGIAFDGKDGLRVGPDYDSLSKIEIKEESVCLQQALQRWTLNPNRFYGNKK